MYADDLVLTDVTEQEVVEKLKKWKKAIEKRGMKVNLRKPNT